MLQNVPNATEIDTIALRLYFAAWRQLVEIIDAITAGSAPKAKIVGSRFEALPYDFEEGVLEENEEELIEYIRKSQPELQSCFSTIQQSQELALKAIICRESPFLLLLGTEIRNLKVDSDFADLKTIDASELVRVINAIRPEELSAQFIQTFNDLRRGRNKIIHLGTFKDHLDPLAMRDILLQQYYTLYPDRRWLKDLQEYMSEHRNTVLYSAYFSSTTNTLGQWVGIEAAVSDKDRRRLIGASKTARLLRCEECHSDEYAQFDPGEGHTLSLERASSKAYCHLCEMHFDIVGKHKCRNCGKCSAYFLHLEAEDTCCYCGFDSNYEPAKTRTNGGFLSQASRIVFEDDE